MHNRLDGWLHVPTLPLKQASSEVVDHAHHAGEREAARSISDDAGQPPMSVAGREFWPGWPV
ncbi:MAG TPA: hypothetical protein VGS19_27580 [Streptosporangiaceae bacterium]|nr:hypothetical protein [Streptosporangiaceae bacterium]